MSEEKIELKDQMAHILYSRNVRHSHSPAVQKLLDMIIDYFPYGERMAAEGKDVVYNCAAGTDQIIYALGAIPLSIVEIGRLSKGDSVRIAEEDFLIPYETCAMVKAILGELYKIKNENKKHLLVSGIMCEPFTEMVDLLDGNGFDLMLIDRGLVPPASEKERVEAVRRDTIKEYGKIAKWLGKELDKEALRRELQRHQRILKKVQTFLNLRKKHNIYVRTLATMLIIMGNDNYYGRPKEYEDALDDLILEMSKLKVGEFHDASLVPLMWDGSRGQEFAIQDAIDDYGAVIVDFQIPNNFAFSYDDTIDPLEACANHIMFPSSGITEESASRWSIEKAARAKAKGILMYGFIGCTLQSISFEVKRKYFREHNVPLLFTAD